MSVAETEHFQGGGRCSRASVLMGGQRGGGAGGGEDAQVPAGQEGGAGREGAEQSIHSHPPGNRSLHQMHSELWAFDGANSQAS